MSRVFIVLGQHRSGTSMVAGILKRLGVEFPSDDLKPTLHNPIEYNESASLTEALESKDILAVHEWVGAQDFDGVWGLKDPRLCDPEKLDAILHALEDHGHEPVIIAVQRDLGAVQRSLEKHGRSPEDAKWLAEENHRLWLESVKKFPPCIILMYEDVVGDPIIHAQMMKGVLDGSDGLETLGTTEAQSITRYVQPSLNRSADTTVPSSMFFSYPWEDGGSAYWRCNLPATVTKTPICIREPSGKHLYGTPSVASGGTVIYQQPVTDWQYMEIVQLRSFGVRVILNIDDYLWAVRKRQERGVARNFTQGVLHWHQECLKECDGLVVTNEWLGRRLRVKAGKKPVWVIPHYMDLERYERARENPIESALAERGQPFAVFEGGAGHEPALQECLKHYGDRLEPAPVAAPDDPVGLCLRTVGADYTRAILQQFGDGFTYEKIGWVNNMEEYPRSLVGASVGLAPSLDNDFYRAKSDLRLREYAACGIPEVWAFGPTYSGTDYDYLLSGGLEEDNELAVTTWTKVLEGDTRGTLPV